jgi:Uma2 family endonuclease
MAESDAARESLIYGVEALSLYFSADPEVYVSGNLFIYFEQGNPKAVVAPDVFVVFGVGNQQRRVYKTWEERDRIPDFVLEITSKSTASEDQGTKKGLYAYLGVREYFQYDPTGEYLEPTLKGFTLHEGNYFPLESEDLSTGGLQIWSSVLGLYMRLEDGQFRFWDAARQGPLLTYKELDRSRQQEQQRAEQEYQRAEQLAAQLKALGIDPDSL